MLQMSSWISCSLLEVDALAHSQAHLLTPGSRHIKCLLYDSKIKKIIKGLEIHLVRSEIFTLGRNLFSCCKEWLRLSQLLGRATEFA